ncbi:DUF4160 domain-containing protein [Arsenicitalea aurantiaca]|uniref:DUF4160 domain-containing protein n=1 Tax=Arsenicitalea aurantiaca TaxID=1783274 RepID=A0A433XAC0_9HYPH|nr:DUF4160 domain-containing protein [Arsenicitalea aurantiaca]RUT31002.1 DUF4160 domain-containing protein [Arsenicitalea aurantiaca]
MPTVLRLDGFRFFFYSGENDEPPHIHVESGDRIAKYWLTPVELALSKRFRAHELSSLRAIVTANRSMFIKAWHEHFDTQL